MSRQYDNIVKQSAQPGGSVLNVGSVQQRREPAATRTSVQYKLRKTRANGTGAIIYMHKYVVIVADMIPFAIVIRSLLCMQLRVDEAALLFSSGRLGSTRNRPTFTHSIGRRHPLPVILFTRSSVDNSRQCGRSREKHGVLLPMADTWSIVCDVATVRPDVLEDDFYKGAEKFGILMVYSLWRKNAFRSCNVYAEQYTNTRKPYRQLYANHFNQLRETGSVTPRNKRETGEESEINILAAVAVNPQVSSRAIAIGSDISQASVLGILHRPEFHS
ncbi:hypothetical protein PR048_009044 [Dryococelus australis]|uniref:Uncharacterized protein n=1 Tax=Dryococelus australis TaxID=614101 RepID=A0ABQ9HYT3_9NEOP|nr:hypothetical protein PR048_009044 [Dryococelus australis]